MELISSWMVTVLPTPAPPKMPVLPPLVMGATRSMTFMPVSKTSIVGDCSSKVGASAWIGRRSTSAGTTSPISIGRPSTLKIRPRVASPTGTAMGWPVALAPAPRANPSVESMATVRTELSPRCNSTSRIRSSSPSRGTSTASKISGNCPAGNSTSTTFPSTWVTVPWISAMFRSLMLNSVRSRRSRSYPGWRRWSGRWLAARHWRRRRYRGFQP